MTKTGLQTMITRRGLLTGAAGFGLSAGRLAYAQSYPSKPIRAVLPYTAGSPNDVIARLIGPILTTRLSQSVVIDNRPGGGTTLGLKTVMGAEADGYTLLFSNTPTHVIAQLVAKGFSYDPIQDFVPMVAVGSRSLG